MVAHTRARIAYILLWFPLASETFIFREVNQLVQAGLDIRVYTMYGKALKGCSQSMKDYPGPVQRMGVKATFRILKAFLAALVRDPAKVWRLMRTGLFRRLRNLESLAENTWCFFAGFLLAELCARSEIELIHAPWANGPATAAWIASRLTGIPFAFTGRAGDIYPPDGLLSEKADAAVLIRTNNGYNLKWLSSFCANPEKIRLVYNGLTFSRQTFPVHSKSQPPYKILSVGRFARTKGFNYLLTAMARLRRENFPCRLTLVGDGSWSVRLRKLCKRLNIEDMVEMPGFIPNDQLQKFMENHDLLVVPSVVHKNGDRDGIPNVIMEACSCGLPVIATDVCGISEVIENGQTGFLIPQRNSRIIANTVRSCIENYAQAMQMAKKARERVLEMFNSERNALCLKELYLKVCQDW